MDNIGNSPFLEKSRNSGMMALDEPNDINSISPWEIDFRQIEPGPMETAVKLLAGRRLNLIDIYMSRAVHQTGVSPEGTITVGVIRPHMIQSWQGRDISSTELVSFGAAEPFDGISTSFFHGVSVSMDQHAIETLAQSLGIDIPESLSASGAPRIIGSHDALRYLRTFIDRLLASHAVGLSDVDEEQIVLCLLSALNCGSKCADKAAPAYRNRGLERAVEMMMVHQNENLSIGNICRETGTSWRTLDRAFKEKFGVGPKRYYMVLRLNRVRSQLLKGRGSHAVSDAANEYGFWHLGEFAREYFRLFGELPSDTAVRRV